VKKQVAVQGMAVRAPSGAKGFRPMTLPGLICFRPLVTSAA
jgi:hypothetical protein